MAVEYNGDKIVLRDTAGTQMSLPRFFQLALVSDDGSHSAKPTSGLYRNDSSEFHGGWDIGTSGATDVPARTPAGGTVVYKGEAGGFGPNLVIIKEDDYERYHYFGHMASASVEQGATVQQGDIVGIIGGYGGSSGSWNPNAYGIHLHYEIMTKNFKVSGGTSHDQADVLDPMGVFDDATLPSGWLFGYDPQTKPTSYAAKENNWDYIDLDKDAVDFGPSGGESPTVQYFETDKRIHDIHPAYQADYYQSDYMESDKVGGIIINCGYARYSGEEPLSGAKDWASYYAGKVALGFYVYTYLNNKQTIDYDSQVEIFKGVMQPIADMHIDSANTQLGFWLDMESEGGPFGTKEENFKQFTAFKQAIEELGFVGTIGVYGAMLADLVVDYNDSDLAETPVWVAYIDLTADEIRSIVAEHGWNQVYIHQYAYTHPDTGTPLDTDRILQPIPYMSSSGGGGGGGGGSYTEVIDVTVEVVPPKRIYFSPVPGLIATKDSRLDKRKQEITISTDAEGADLYYTVDGSSPYQYTVVGDTVSYELSSSAIHYDKPIEISKDIHIRVVAVESGTVSTFEKPLAKGSGTFLFKYQDLVHDWEAEKKAYAISDKNASFFEENKQAFLRLHATKTPEEILYADVYKHNKEIETEDAKDNVTSSEGTPAGSEEV